MSQLATQTYDLTKLLSGRYYCSACAARVCGEAELAEGVTSAHCDLEEGELTVTYHPSAIKPAELQALVERLALEASDRVLHAVYRVTGLD